MFARHTALVVTLGIVALFATACSDEVADDTCKTPQPTDYVCCAADGSESAAICLGGGWGCAGAQAAPGQCMPDMDMNMDGSDTSDADGSDVPMGMCTDPVVITCCSGDVEATPVCIGSNWQCPSGFNEAPFGGCSGDVSTACMCTGTGEWCDYSDNNCGNGRVGMCQGPPIDCLEPIEPVCGCDGNIYDNACLAHAAGTDVNARGTCTAPLDTFPCGEKFCASNTEVCRIQISDVAGFPDEYACEELAAGCMGTPSCDCYSMDPCGMGTLCTARGSDVYLTCPGG